MSAQTPFQILLEIDQRCRALAAGLPSQQAGQGDTAADTAADRYLAERAAAAPGGEEETFDAEADEEAVEAESAPVNA